MENNTTPNKLDETVKENLSNYDAKYDSGDWARMERMLDAAPKSSVAKGSYNIAIFIGAAVLVGGFFIYKGINTSKTSIDKPAETTITPTENKTKTLQPAPVVVKTTSPVTPAVNEQKIISPEVKPKVPDVKNAVTAVENKEKVATEKIKNDQEKKQKSTKSNTESSKNQKVIVMGNEPIFGDMIDSSKGIIHKTKEKDSTKKAAKSKRSSNIGWNGLFNLNADSIRKQKELMLKDTLQK
ncbi:MAG: hypothetical protein NTX97_03610 [Bacteroidetes bacterium]|nr:hypothetical protein [Bacteroidota bacterium]